MNPRLCNICELFAQEHLGGAEVELAMLLADVRGSTTLAERVGTPKFTGLIDRFYREVSGVLIRSDAMLEKLIGDEVAALYFPGFAGPNYSLRAVEAAVEVLRVTGHGDEAGPWVPVGVGVHQGTAFVGAVGSRGGVVEITALGDAVNATARLSQRPSPGEVLVSDAAMEASGIGVEGFEHRQLSLKGRREPVKVWLVRAGDAL